MKQPLIDQIWPLFAPLSHASGPIRVGLSRRRLQRAGLERREVRLLGVPITIYASTPTNPAARERDPLVLIHGLGDNAMTWAALLGLLGNDRPVYTLDLPGYGLSGLPAGQTYATIETMRTMLATLVIQEIGRPVVLVGNSLGGWLAVDLALNEAEWVCGMVLLNPGGAALDGELSYQLFRERLEADDLATARQTLLRIYGQLPLPMVYLSQNALQDVFGRRVVRDFIANAQPEAFLTAEQLQAVNVPSLLIWGMADTFLPEGSFAFFRDHLQDAEIRSLPGVGHVPQVTRPHIISSLIEEFCSQFSYAPTTRSWSDSPSQSRNISITSGSQ